jgi:hypothetical protein
MAWIYSWSCHRPYESDAGEDQKIREADEFQKVLVEMRGPWYLLPFLEAAIHFASIMVQNNGVRRFDSTTS